MLVLRGTPLPRSRLLSHRAILKDILLPKIKKVKEFALPAFPLTFDNYI